MIDGAACEAQNPPLSITLFENVKNAYGKRYDLDWNSLRVFLQQCASYTVKTKGDQQLIKLATFADNYRSNHSLEKIYGIEGDYDGGALTPLHAVELLRKANIEAVIYTTASHIEEKPRFRVLCPLSCPVSPQDRAQYVARLNSALNESLAEESYVPSQSYYIGSVENHCPMQCYHISGQLIDLIQNFPSVGMQYGPSMIATPKRANNGKKAPFYDLALEALLSRHPGDGDRAWWLAFSGSFFTATRYVQPEVPLADWQEWNTQYGEKNNPQENLSTWRDFERNGTSGDFQTLAEMSNNANAKGWAYFGDPKLLTRNFPLKKKRKARASSRKSR